MRPSVGSEFNRVIDLITHSQTWSGLAWLRWNGRVPQLLATGTGTPGNYRFIVITLTGAG